MTFEPSLSRLVRELEDAVEEATGGSHGGNRVRGHFVPGALDDLKEGRGGEHDRKIAAAAAEAGASAAVVLGQFSMARALPAVRSALEDAGKGCPVLATPNAAVDRLRSLANKSVK